MLSFSVGVVVMVPFRQRAGVKCQLCVAVMGSMRAVVVMPVAAYPFMLFTRQHYFYAVVTAVPVVVTFVVGVEPVMYLLAVVE